MKGLYIHIPFCKRICSYCDFPKKVPYNDLQILTYINHLKKEILSYNLYFKEIDTIYIGGGTPNFLNDEVLEDLLSFVNNLNLKVKEYTIECNPEFLSFKQATLFKKYGINRISLGVETFNKKGLKLLNRGHNAKDVKIAINNLKKVGLNNINLDLIYDYFKETYKTLKKDLRKALSFKVTHLSLYSLILEENTLLKRKYKEEDINNDLSQKMSNFINKTLAKKHFIHYEISNYALKGYESLHNIKYWEKEEYIGCGMGATSYLNHQRITNSYLINNYLKDKDKYIEELSILDEKKEFIIMGLRMLKGIDKEKYYKRFKTSLEVDFNYSKLLNLDLLIENNKTLKLTKKGLDLGNIVFEEFI